MKQIKGHQIPQSFHGVAIAEYAMLLGIIGVVVVASLSLLGESTSNLFLQTSTTVTQTQFNWFTPATTNLGSALAVTGNSSAAGVVHLKGGGYYNLVVDPVTGQPMLQMVNGSSGVNVNVSSVEGSRYNTLGGLMLASKLDQLAQQETDPQLKAYYSQLAKYSYYIGGAEGVMDNVKDVSQASVYLAKIDPATGLYQAYTLGDGLRDINSYQLQLQTLLTNPPANLNAQEFATVMPYAVDVTNIAQNYLNNFQQFISPTGQVTENFGDASMCHSTAVYGGCDLGTPGPGAALADVSNAVSNPPNVHEMLGQTYDSLVSLDQLKINASKVLTDYSVQDVPVVSTFKDAVTVDSHS